MGKEEKNAHVLSNIVRTLEPGADEESFARFASTTARLDPLDEFELLLELLPEVGGEGRGEVLDDQLNGRYGGAPLVGG